MSKENFADVNSQHIFYSVHGAGKPLILLHGGIDPDSFGSNLAELAKGRQVIAVHLQAHGRTPDTDRPLRCETMGDDVAALIGHLKLGKADVMGYSLGSFVALQTRHPPSGRGRPARAPGREDEARRRLFGGAGGPQSIGGQRRNARR